MELYPGARRTLRELATNPKYQEVKIAVASTSLEPAYSRACIEGSIGPESRVDARRPRGITARGQNFSGRSTSTSAR